LKHNWPSVTAALSIRQPWAWLIVNGFKDIENRSWRTEFRGRVLIHAGKKYGKEERAIAEAAQREFGIDIPEALDLGGIVGGVEIVDCVTESESKWFEGTEHHPYGFVLETPVVLPFRPVTGRLGFFNVCGEKSFLAREVAR